MSATAATQAPGLGEPVEPRPVRGRRAPRPLLIAGILVGIGAALPAAYLAIVVSEDLGTALDVVLSSRTAAESAF